MTLSGGTLITSTTSPPLCLTARWVSPVLCCVTCGYNRRKSESALRSQRGHCCASCHTYSNKCSQRCWRPPQRAKVKSCPTSTPWTDSRCCSCSVRSARRVRYKYSWMLRTTRHKLTVKWRCHSSPRVWTLFTTPMKRARMQVLTSPSRYVQNMI